MFAESSKGYSNFSHDVHGAGLIGLIDQRKWQLWVNGKSSTTGDRSGQQKWQRWVNGKSSTTGDRSGQQKWQRWVNVKSIVIEQQRFWGRLFQALKIAGL
jgi:hypothetical protein